MAKQTYSVYMEGFVVMEGRGKAEYVGKGEGETFAEAAYDACVKRYGKGETDYYYQEREGRAFYWGCEMFDNYEEAAKNFG